jgi:ABC-type nitrate/sulfonate/bicarbonate transport system permease component
MESSRGFLIPGLLLIFWEMAARANAIPEALSRPSLIVEAIQSAVLVGSLPLATLQTLQTTMLGLILATAIGIAIGLLLGMSPFLNGVVGPSIEAFRPVPAVALVPLALLLFGFGVSLEVSIVAFACVWPIIVVTIAAVQGLDERLTQIARGLEFPLYLQIVKLILPAAIGRIWVGIRIAAGIALIVAVTVEIIINPRGLGYAMIFAQQMFQVDLVYGYVVWTGILGWLFNLLIQLIDRNWLSRYVMDER